jgi:hypothetical protein
MPLETKIIIIIIIIRRRIIIMTIEKRRVKPLSIDGNLANILNSRKIVI